MSDDSDNLISVNILNKNYKIKCPPEKAFELQQAAEHLDEQMRRMRQSGAISSTDSLAIVSALNISHELLHLKKQKNQYIDSMHERIHALQKRIENFLASKEEVAV